MSLSLIFIAVFDCRRHNTSGKYIYPLFLFYKDIHVSASTSILDICQFWGTTALFRPVKRAPKSVYIAASAVVAVVTNMSCVQLLFLIYKST